MKYDKNTHYWLLGDDKQWQPIFYNVDGQFLIGTQFFTVNKFEKIFKGNKVVKAIMPIASNPLENVVMCDGMTKEDFEAQYLCKFEVSKEDMMINDHVEAYLRASSGASFAESKRLASDLHK